MVKMRKKKIASFYQDNSKVQLQVWLELFQNTEANSLSNIIRPPKLIIFKI